MNANEFKGSTVLITGASFGIGEAFAKYLASLGANLVLTARSADKLRQIADELKQKYAVSVHVFPADLSNDKAPQQIYDQVNAAGLSVDVLINNAGFGKWAYFHAVDIETYQQVLTVNINALVRLTYLFLPNMLARGKGGVINVASTAAFQPVPYVAVYSASKSFVLNFTEALAGEYSEKGLKFFALCPGNTETNFMKVANPEIDTSDERVATPESVVRAGIGAFVKGRKYHVPGMMNYLLSLLPRIFPRAVAIRIVASMFKRRVAPFSINYQETFKTGA
jgi:hypothetical protein